MSDRIAKLGAGAYALAVVIGVCIPFLAIPALVSLMMPGTEFRFHWTWWNVILMEIAFFASTFVSSAIVVVGSKTLPILQGRPILWFKEAVEFFTLLSLYSILLKSTLAALVSTVSMTILAAVSEPILDRKLEDQRKLARVSNSGL